MLGFLLLLFLFSINLTHWDFYVIVFLGNIFTSLFMCDEK